MSTVVQISVYLYNREHIHTVEVCVDDASLLTAEYLRNCISREDSNFGFGKLIVKDTVLDITRSVSDLREVLNSRYIFSFIVSASQSNGYLEAQARARIAIAQAGRYPDPQSRSRPSDHTADAARYTRLVGNVPSAEQKQT